MAHFLVTTTGPPALRIATWTTSNGHDGYRGYLQHIGENSGSRSTPRARNTACLPNADQLALCYAIVDIPTDLNTMNKYMNEPQTIGTGKEEGRYLSVVGLISTASTCL